MIQVQRISSLLSSKTFARQISAQLSSEIILSFLYLENYLCTPSCLLTFFVMLFEWLLRCLVQSPNFGDDLQKLLDNNADNFHHFHDEIIIYWHMPYNIRMIQVAARNMKTRTMFVYGRRKDDLIFESKILTVFGDLDSNRMRWVYMYYWDYYIESKEVIFWRIHSSNSRDHLASLLSFIWILFLSHPLFLIVLSINYAPKRIGRAFCTNVHETNH